MRLSEFRNELRAARERVRTGTIIETRCGPIEYGTYGDGPPVLVLHGTSGGWDQGIVAARDLASRGFRLIAPSRFGYLRTPLPANPSAEAEADTWAAFLDALGIERLPVISFSAGAAPAVQLALRYPERVSQLVLIVPGAGGLIAKRSVSPPRFVLRALYHFDFPLWAVARAVPRIAHLLVAVPEALIGTLGDESRAKLDEMIATMMPVSERSRGVMNDGQTQGSATQYPLERIVAPTLLISAEDDLYKTLPVARHAAELIPNAKLLAFETGGHLLLGHSTEVFDAVADFLVAAPQMRKMHAVPAAAR